MSSGTWEPSNLTDNYWVDQDLLQRFIDLSRRDGFADLPQFLSPDDVRLHSTLMRLPASRWRELAKPFDNDELVHLVRFFTVAEHSLPGWQAGADSPVIPLVKELRHRGHPPSHELLRWIKANSDNHYLPNGKLL